MRLTLYFKKISLSALSGSSRARRSVMTPPAVLKRRSEGTKRTEISGTWYNFGRNRSQNRIRKNGQLSGQPEPEPDIRYIPNQYRSVHSALNARRTKNIVILELGLTAGA